MVRPSVEDLHRWYATLAGRRVARALGSLIAPAVPVIHNARILALGYPAPLLMGFDPARVERLAMAMPGEQGAHRWPSHRPNVALAVSHNNLPFTDALFDTVILVHALEFAGRPHRMLREIWRVLSPAGRLIVIVPNRLGVWTHFESNPFGSGRPYARGQLHRLLEDSMFEPMSQRTALVAPPGGFAGLLGALLGAVAPGLGGIRLALAQKADGLRPATVRRVAIGTAAQPA